jgi:two-component system nitrogen regulation response regulator GlnG
MARLLLIDDDSALIPEQVRQAFPAPAHRVEVAGTGAEGLERVRAGPLDVILLDSRLPDQSVRKVYEQILRLDARIPVIDEVCCRQRRPASCAASCPMADQSSCSPPRAISV